jgi:hypothetical protein
MPASSKSQQRFMGMVRSYQKGELKNPSKAVKDAAKQMNPEDVEDYAETDHEGLPNKVKTEVKERDYKDEYKKFQSSTKSKKYRAELNKYNRKKGTYGNGDGKDASHKGGKIAGFEDESKNRGRKEKSRLKKKTSENVDMNEQKLREMIREVLSEAAKPGKWVVYTEDSSGNNKVIKAVKSHRAAVILMNKIVDSDKYDNVAISAVSSWNEKPYNKSIKESKLNEAKEEKVYMLNGMLWLSYSPDSGQTTRVRGRGWITDQSGSKNFDSGVKGFAKWSKTQKPIKKKTASNGSKVSLFKIPEYSGGSAKEYTIWGGDEKPKKWVYLLISIGKKINVISVFHSKAEAMSWIGHTAENVKEGKLKEGKFSKEQLNLLKLGYGSLNKLDPSSPTYKKFIKFLEKLPKDELKQLANADIKFVSMLAKNRIKEGKLTEVNKSLPPFEIAKRMMKSKYWNKAGKGFSEKVIKKFRGRGVTPKSLDKWLPDYIDGKEISKLFEGKLTEKNISQDRWDKALEGTWIVYDGATDKTLTVVKNKEMAIKMIKRELDKSPPRSLNIGIRPLGEGKLTEKKESAIDVVKRIVKNHQHEKGVDVQTANLILRIHSAYDKNPALQKKFEKMPLKKMAQGVWRFVK